MSGTKGRSTARYESCVFGGLFFACVLCLLPAAASAQALTYANTGAITIPAAGTGAPTGAPANPYPSTISVANVSAVVTKVTVTLKQITHTFPADIDVLLVSPTGVKLLLMSDVIGGSAAAALTGQTYTFDSAADTILDQYYGSVPHPRAAPPPSGVFQPTNHSGDVDDIFPAPAPAGPY
jgi:Proprotein convertase P-domain